MQVGVLRVVVVVRVAAEAEVGEEEGGQPVGALARRGVRQQRLRVAAEGVELPDLRRDIQARVGDATDAQGAVRQIDARVRTARAGGEIGGESAQTGGLCCFTIAGRLAAA